MAPDTRFIDGFALGMWQTNCYLLGDAELGSCVVVDPGQTGAEAVVTRLAERDVRCEVILLTHGHLDHLWAAPELAARLDVPVLLHPDDRWLWRNPAASFDERLEVGVLLDQFGLDWQPPWERLDDLADGQTLSFAGYRFTVRHTPGHTPGSCVFIVDATARGRVEAAPTMLSGDLLFAGSVGRTDLARGSWDEQMRSLERVVLPLDDGMAVLPGHGPSTTVGTERATNPYLDSLARQ